TATAATTAATATATTTATTAAAAAAATTAATAAAAGRELRAQLFGADVQLRWEQLDGTADGDVQLDLGRRYTLGVRQDGIAHLWCGGDLQRDPDGYGCWRDQLEDTTGHGLDSAATAAATTAAAATAAAAAAATTAAAAAAPPPAAAPPAAARTARAPGDHTHRADGHRPGG